MTDTREWAIIYVCPMCQGQQAELYGWDEDASEHGRCKCGGRTNYYDWVPQAYLLVEDENDC